MLANTYIKSICKRMTDMQLEANINYLEDERKRRRLIRDDEIMTMKDGVAHGN
jgi:hypothetical protein